MGGFWKICVIRLKSEDEHLALYIIRILYFGDPLKESFFAVSDKMKQFNQWKKHIQEYVELINLAQNSTFKKNKWGTIGQLWLKIAWNMQRDVKHVNSMQILSINHLNYYILQLLLGRLTYGD